MLILLTFLFCEYFQVWKFYYSIHMFVLCCAFQSTNFKHFHIISSDCPSYLTNHPFDKMNALSLFPHTEYMFHQPPINHLREPENSRCVIETRVKVIFQRLGVWE